MSGSQTLYRKSGSQGEIQTLNDLVRHEFSNELLSPEEKVDRLLSLIENTDDRFTLCCVLPTRKLVMSLAGLMQQDCIEGSGQDIILSIGSGSGILELLVQRFLKPPSVIVGVETHPINLFLPSECCILTQRLDILDVAKVRTLFACYLRRPGLVVDYLNLFPEVNKIILIGPRTESVFNDESASQVLLEWGTISVANDWDDVLAAWDQVLVVRRKLPKTWSS
ncbi:uncharacterized protein BJ171DRAFT_512726 [Polychytrium aggregatum]|uniref:uncharacterized protein n=1 Tax=Polychytrium aggregatum TaxID=110093 RepID=UPI0022FDFF7D|nr:uncharacterized protein BJ171DRAFT_512726 [Polychytrium aggregatum]KAI9202621.1 hypothetical protein BJ171DRAFT_512726 [Polychytrium aggregatum]